MIPTRSIATAISAVALAVVLSAGVNFAQEQKPKDVPYVPTPQTVVDKMLELAAVTKDDVVYDLGSGDGRIVITAAKKYGVRGVGVDIDPERIKEANANAVLAGVADRVKFIEQDLFKTDLKEASVVTLYLLPEVNLRLRPKLWSELKPGTRVVSHAFDMGDWTPEQKVEVEGKTIYFWVIPKNAATKK
jgi:SAM-dependent methyltransferase